MKIGIVTNIPAPYRTLQINEFSKIKNTDITVYYTTNKDDGPKWGENKNQFKEVYLKGYKVNNMLGYINRGILDIIKENDILILGGYEQITYMVLSVLCKIYKKKFILFFDGISTNRLTNRENTIKKMFKKIVINRAEYIMGNGTISKKYFSEIFMYPEDKIKNQFLTIDTEKINQLYEKRHDYRILYRNKLKIDINEKVVLYSGRLIDIKNVSSVVRALSIINDKNITLLITGGGTNEDEIKSLAKKLGVNLIITGFIREQEELFKHYYVADLLILPSFIEPWGLVVNEAMASGLPVIVSKVCGCSMDLVLEDDNGYLIEPNDIDDISKKIYKVLYESDCENMGNRSRQIIKSWTFKNSRKSLEECLKDF